MPKKDHENKKPTNGGEAFAAIKPRKVLTNPTGGPVETVYANNVELNISNWDFRFRFGEIQNASETEVFVEEKARVIMSPQHTKAFLGVLQANVAKYEETFGEIKIALPQSTAAARKPS